MGDVVYAMKAGFGFRYERRGLGRGRARNKKLFSLFSPLSRKKRREIRGRIQIKHILLLSSLVFHCYFCIALEFRKVKAGEGGFRWWVSWVS